MNCILFYFLVFVVWQLYNDHIRRKLKAFNFFAVGGGESVTIFARVLVLEGCAEFIKSYLLAFQIQGYNFNSVLHFALIVAPCSVARRFHKHFNLKFKKKKTGTWE